MHRGVNPGNLQPTRKKKASPRPPDWFKRFQQSLERNPGTQRLRTELLPQCELFNLALFVVEYVRDSNPPELEKRRQRGLWRGKVLREQEAFLRKKVRTLKRQLSTAAIYDPGRHRERELETSITKLAATRDMLARAQEAHNTKRLGVSAAQYRLFVIPEYVRIKSGLTLQPCELGALVRAARYALGRLTHGYTDPDLLSRALRNFEKRNPVLCGGLKLHAVNHIEQSSAYHLTM